MMGSMERDWVDDESMSVEETLRRFEALNPEPTRGPRKGQHLSVPVTTDSETASAPEGEVRRD
jgi:hypothetical protein